MREESVQHMAKLLSQALQSWYWYTLWTICVVVQFLLAGETGRGAKASWPWPSACLGL